MNRDEEDIFLDRIIKEIETSSHLRSRYLLRKLINTPSTKTEPDTKIENLVAKIKKEISYLESIKLTDFGQGGYSGFKKVLEWLEEASPIDRNGEAVNFVIWLFSKSGMWFDEDYLLWNIPDYVNTNEWLEEYGQGFPEGQFRFTTDELFKVFKSLPLGG